MPPFSSISLVNLTQITTIQTQKLNKNNKNIHNGDCILAKKKTILPQRTRKSCVIEEVKAKFFAITVN